jgi:hypothetical protein
VPHGVVLLVLDVCIPTLSGTPVVVRALIGSVRALAPASTLTKRPLRWRTKAVRHGRWQRSKAPARRRTGPVRERDPGKKGDRDRLDEGHCVTQGQHPPQHWPESPERAQRLCGGVLGLATGLVAPDVQSEP